MADSDSLQLDLRQISVFQKRRQKIVQLCPSCGCSLASARFTRPTWIECRVRSCPRCGLGVAGPLGRRTNSPRHRLEGPMAILRLVLIPVGLVILTAVSMVASDSLPNEWKEDLLSVPHEFILAFGLGILGGVISTLIASHASPNTCTTGWITITWPIGFLILLVQSPDSFSSLMGINLLLLLLLGIGFANFTGALVAAHATSMVRNLADRPIGTSLQRGNHA